jgi:hypothetical protein
LNKNSFFEGEKRKRKKKKAFELRVDSIIFNFLKPVDI